MRERPMNAFVAHALRESERSPRQRGSRRASAPCVLPRRLSIDELAALAAAGDMEAVGRLYDELVGPIYRYVAVRIHRREDVEDLTQVVFERIVDACRATAPPAVHSRRGHSGSRATR